MNYMTLRYAAFCAGLLAAYYLLSRIRKGRYQWLVLLAGSLLFWATWMDGVWSVLGFAIPVATGWAGGILIERERKSDGGKAILALCIALIALPLVLVKICGFFPNVSFGSVASVGLSFYTLQLIAYVVDVYRGKIVAQRNPLKHLLFSSFFPQLLQGPIPRYKELGEQLFSPHPFVYENMSKGALRVVWGFFLKLMIADKAAIFVSRVFDRPGEYIGSYILLAAALYALQLYADFYACTSISLGVAQLFGIELVNNFRRPYLAVSVKDFWRRWHITLSSWLRDYIYIPLGGNRKGKARKYLNIFFVFLISGLWHGNGLQFILWGCLHGVYQIIGDLSFPAREKIYGALRIPRDSAAYKLIKRIGVFIPVTFAWIFFRSADLGQGFRMVRDAFAVWNPWAVFGNELFTLGLDVREFAVLAFAVFALMLAGHLQEKGLLSMEWLAGQHLVIRWGILLGIIAVFWIFGTYGWGYDPRAFIYGGF